MKSQYRMNAFIPIRLVRIQLKTMRCQKTNVSVQSINKDVVSKQEVLEIQQLGGSGVETQKESTILELQQQVKKKKRVASHIIVPII